MLPKRFLVDKKKCRTCPTDGPTYHRPVRASCARVRAKAPLALPQPARAARRGAQATYTSRCWANSRRKLDEVCFSLGETCLSSGFAQPLCQDFHHTILLLHLSLECDHLIRRGGRLAKDVALQPR